MKKFKFVGFVLMLELFVIASIALGEPMAGLAFGVPYFILYNFAYGLVFSILLPILWHTRNHLGMNDIGFKKVGVRQMLVIGVALLIALSRLVPLIQENTPIPFNLIPECLLPLIMTTFFEEFLFRGFMQTQIEKRFGAIVAIIASALVFSLYHIGYPGFRNFGSLALLFFVGLEFAIAYKLSGNNLFVAYFVNLPNAILTYMLTPNQFNEHLAKSALPSAISIVLIASIMIGWHRYEKRKRIGQQNN